MQWFSKWGRGPPVVLVWHPGGPQKKASFFKMTDYRIIIFDHLHSTVNGIVPSCASYPSLHNVLLTSVCVTK